MLYSFLHDVFPTQKTFLEINQIFSNLKFLLNSILEIHLRNINGTNCSAQGANVENTCLLGDDRVQNICDTKYF